MPVMTNCPPAGLRIVAPLVVLVVQPAATAAPVALPMREPTRTRQATLNAPRRHIQRFVCIESCPPSHPHLYVDARTQGKKEAGVVAEESVCKDACDCLPTDVGSPMAAYLD